LCGEYGGIGVDGGGVDANEVRGELVDADGLPVELEFESGEVVAISESVEEVGESVVVGVSRQDGLAEKSGEGEMVLLDPRFDVIETMIALGDDEEKPEGEDIGGGEVAGPVERSGKMASEGSEEVDPLEMRPKDGQVGDRFDAEQAGFAGVHPVKLRTNPIPDNAPEHERTVGSKQ